jgi:hypothetical protein
MDRMSDLFRSAHRGKKEIGARLCNRKLGLTDEPKSSLLRQCPGWAEVKVGDEHLRLFSEHSRTRSAGFRLQRKCKELGCSLRDRGRCRTGERPLQHTQWHTYAASPIQNYLRRIGKNLVQYSSRTVGPSLQIGPLASIECASRRPLAGLIASIVAQFLQISGLIGC